MVFRFDWSEVSSRNRDDLQPMPRLWATEFINARYYGSVTVIRSPASRSGFASHRQARKSQPEPLSPSRD
jgi:hypothetical protein